jgi:argininosuccinate lyase
MQEDKEPLFDTIDTVKGCLKIYADMIGGMELHAERMRAAAAGGFSTATDVADYLVRKGLPFRDAHEAVGKAVQYCIEKGKELTDLTIDEWRGFSARLEDDIFAAITLDASVAARSCTGGTSPERVREEIERAGKRK